MVEEVPDQHAREDAVAERERVGVGGREVGARDGTGSEARPREGAVDAERLAAPREAHEVCPLAAADLQAGERERPEPRPEQRLFHGREAGIGRRPVEVRRVGGGKPILRHGTAHGRGS